MCESSAEEESAAKVREVRNPLPVLESRQTTLRYATPTSGNALFGERSYGTREYLRQHWLAEGGRGDGTASRGRDARASSKSSVKKFRAETTDAGIC